jgi:unsaturated rhamnogalacturonyl hydrolase
MVDAWFNSQTRNNAAGQSELFHYKWDDEADSGFSFFGDALARYGMQLTEAKVAPTATVLRGADLYVIASPDTIAKNPQAHTMDKASGDAIQAWVQAGGVLLLMMNDAANTEFEGMNTLSDRFGIHFNPVVRNKVTGENYEQGKVVIPGSTAIFANPHTTFMKDTCTMTLTKLANPVLKKDGDVLMAVSVVGQGTVIAVADPWLYNEYTDGRKLPAAYDTYAAAVEFSGWMLRQMH